MYLDLLHIQRAEGYPKPDSQATIDWKANTKANGEFRTRKQTWSSEPFVDGLASVARHCEATTSFCFGHFKPREPRAIDRNEASYSIRVLYILIERAQKRCHKDHYLVLLIWWENGGSR